jgi:hypothetical protein
MNFKDWLIQEACPIATQVYGGLPDGGGYGSNTEYEIGAQSFAEAAHCILGSLGKALGDNGLRYELGHISEEMGIIRRVIREYSKDLYITRVWENHPYKEKSVESIRSSSKKLRETARQKRSQIETEKEPIKSIAIATYDAVILLTLAMEESIKYYPDMTNAFQNESLRSSVEKLGQMVDKITQNIE